MELYRQPLSLGYFERTQKQVIVERFISQTDCAVAPGTLLYDVERFHGFSFARLMDRQPGTIGNDALQADMSCRACFLHCRNKRLDHLAFPEAEEMSNSRSFGAWLTQRRRELDMTQA